MSTLSRLLAATALSTPPRLACAPQPAPVGVDYLPSGNAVSETYAMERVVIEPLPWPGDMSRVIDTTNRGTNKVEVADAKTGQLLYSRTFSTIFGEWQSTEE